MTAKYVLTDHGELSGLADDDHVQYLLINGTRAMTGDLNMNGNNVISPGYVYSLSNMGIGGSNIDPFFWFLSPVGTHGTSQIWPTGRTFTSNTPPVFDFSASDTVNYTPAVLPYFFNLQRVVTNNLAYNTLLMHYIFNNFMEYQNANGVAANLGLEIAINNQPIQRGDGAAITSLGHVGWFDNVRLQAVNAGSLALTYVINAYLAANFAANTAATFFIHLWIVNPGGAGASVNEYGMWISDLTKAINAYGIYSQIQAGATKWFLFQTAGGAKIQLTGDLGFYGTAPAAQQTVTGSRGGNAALASLLTALATYGLIIDSTTP